MCFAPGTTAAVIARYERESEAYEGSLSSEYRLNNSWTTTATNGSVGGRGTPITLTWSIVPDDTAVPARSATSADGAPSNLRTFLNGIYGNEATWLPIFQQVFDRWSQLTGVTYVYSPNDDGASLPGFTGASSTNGGEGALGVRGDVRIGGRRIDGNSNVLAYNYYPNVGDMVIDTADNFYTNTADGSLRLRNVLWHEFGHGLGYAHTCPLDNSKLMEPFINLNFQGPQLDDVLASQRAYGDALEKTAARNNDTVANATNLGQLANGTLQRGAFTPNDGGARPPAAGFDNDEPLSIDSTGDVDVFKFTVSGRKQFSATLSPMGGQYLEGPQSGNGSCPTGTTTIPQSYSNLGFELIGADGTTVLTSVNANPAGSAEQIPAVILPNSSGPFSVRIFGDTDNIQLYSLALTLADAPTGANFITTGANAVSDTGSNGNGNGAIDPGESNIALTLPLRNIGITGATNVTGTLSSLTPTVSVVTGTASYSSIASEASASNTSPFVIAVSSSHACGAPISLRLNVSSPQGNSTVNYSLATGGLSTRQVFFDNMENGAANWTHSGVGSDTWAIVTDGNAHSPTQSWRSTDVATVSDQRLVLNAQTIPLGSNQRLRFWHTYAFDDASNAYDGGVLEVSTDGGANYADLETKILSGGYNGTLDSRFANPLSNRRAWTKGALGAMTEVVVDLSSYGGQSVLLRWRQGTDNAAAAAGWFVDDVSITVDDSVCGVPAANPATLSVAPVSQNEGAGGATDFVFSISLSAPAPSGGVKFDIATADGTAFANLDYVPNTLTGRTIAQGQSSATFTVVVNGDLVSEPNETFAVNVSNISGATNTSANTSGTILNDDSSLAPTDIALSPQSVDENKIAGTVVGTFSTTDADANDSFTYTLVTGVGATDNGSFTIDAGTLKTGASFNFETKSSYSIRVRSTDRAGLSFEEALTIAVNNVNEAPVAQPDETLSGRVGQALSKQLTATDVDAGDSANLSYTLTTGALPAGLTLSSGGLISGSPTATTSAAGTAVTVTVSDGKGGSDTIVLTFVIDEAPSLVVNTSGDSINSFDGATSLREAMILANTNAGEDTITINLAAPRKTITLGSGSPLPTIVGTLNIDGPEAGVEVTGRVGPNNALLSVANGATARLTKLFFNGSKTGVRNSGTFFLTDGGFTSSTTNLDNTLGATATLTNCVVERSSTGLQNSGALTVNTSRFSASTNAIVNVAGATITIKSSGFEGNAVGAINTGTLTLSNSTLVRNGDGVRNQGGDAIVIQSTFVDNTHAVLNAPSARLRLLRATVAGNGLGLNTGGGTVELRTSLLVGNGQNLVGTPTSGGFNLTNVTAQVAGLEVDGNGLPMLKPNGGPTATVALLGGSIAINTGEVGISSGNDQRGTDFPRVVGGRADIGAFEFGTATAPQNGEVAPSGGNS